MSANRPPPGLCDLCCHARRITSARGSLFTLCERSQTDRRYPRYPNLPVLACAGFEPGPATEGDLDARRGRNLDSADITTNGR